MNSSNQMRKLPAVAVPNGRENSRLPNPIRTVREKSSRTSRNSKLQRKLSKDDSDVEKLKSNGQSGLAPLRTSGHSRPSGKLDMPAMNDSPKPGMSGGRGGVKASGLRRMTSIDDDELPPHIYSRHGLDRGSRKTTQLQKQHGRNVTSESGAVVAPNGDAVYPNVPSGNNTTMDRATCQRMRSMSFDSLSSDEDDDSSLPEITRVDRAAANGDYGINGTGRRKNQMLRRKISEDDIKVGSFKTHRAAVYVANTSQQRPSALQCLTSDSGAVLRYDEREMGGSEEALSSMAAQSAAGGRAVDETDKGLWTRVGLARGGDAPVAGTGGLPAGGIYAGGVSAAGVSACEITAGGVPAALGPKSIFVDRSKPNTDPQSLPTGELVCSTPLLFWRCKLRSVVYIYHHEIHECYEVLAVDTESGVILPRLYLSAPKIFDWNELSLSKSQTLEMRLKKRSMVKKQRINFGAEYILASLDAEYTDASRAATRVFIRKFNAEESSLCDLSIEKPLHLLATVFDKKQLAQTANSVRTSEVLCAVTLATTKTVGPLVQRAQMYDQQANEILATPIKPAIQSKCIENTTINPNCFSAARWRWIWAIEKVLMMNRITVTMQIFFGGSKSDGMQPNSFLQRVNGKLEIARPPPNPSNINPYIYGDRSTVDQFTPSPNFRSLRYSGSKCDHVQLVRDLQVQRMQDLSHIKVERKRPSSFKGTTKWSPYERNRSRYIIGLSGDVEIQD